MEQLYGLVVAPRRIVFGTADAQRLQHVATGNADGAQYHVVRPVTDRVAAELKRLKTTTLSGADHILLTGFVSSFLLADVLRESLANLAADAKRVGHDIPADMLRGPSISAFVLTRLDEGRVFYAVRWMDGEVIEEWADDDQDRPGYQQVHAIAAAKRAADDGQRVIVVGDGIPAIDGAIRLVGQLDTQERRSDAVLALKRVGQEFRQFSELKLPRDRRPLVIGGLLTAAAIAVIAWVLLGGTASGPVKQDAAAVDPYAQLKSELTITGTNVKVRLNGLARELLVLSDIDWIELAELTAEPSASHVRLKATTSGVTLDGLRRELGRQGYAVSMSEGEFVAAKPVGRAQVLRTPVLVPVTSVEAYVSQAMQAWFDGVTVAAQESGSSGAWVAKILELRVQGVTAHDIDTIGSLLTGLPISFVGAELRPVGKHQFEGAIKVTVLGVKGV